MIPYSKSFNTIFYTLLAFLYRSCFWRVWKQCVCFGGIIQSYFNSCAFQLLVVGGSFGLREFTQIRYDAQRIRKKVCVSVTRTSQLTSVSVTNTSLWPSPAVSLEWGLPFVMSQRSSGLLVMAPRARGLFHLDVAYRIFFFWVAISNYFFLINLLICPDYLLHFWTSAFTKLV